MNTQPSASSAGGKWGIIIVVLVLLIGGFFSLNRKDDGMGGSDGEQMTGSLAELLKRGGDWKCTWSVDMEGNTSSGTIYVSGDKFASVVTTNTGMGEMTVQGISDGEYMYTWGSAMPGGVKMKLDETQQAEPEVPGAVDVDGANQLGDEYSYECDPWNADASMFVPPAGITFSDLSEMMEGLPQMPELPEMPELPQM